jgi:hypothetical protein
MSIASQSLAAAGVAAEPTSAAGRWRVALGAVLLLHGLAHSSAVTWPGDTAPAGLVTVAWTVALWGYIAAGLGLLGVPLVRRIWKPAMTAAMGASLVLLTLAAGAIAFTGGLVDLAVLTVLTHWATRQAATAGTVPRVVASPAHRVAKGIALVAFAYATIVIVARPVTTTWGTTEVERQSLLPGDALVPDARYRLDHAITINAPADSVWPWLVQIGQDRGGFYSYDWLERLFGDNVHNADRIHPEWQQLSRGDRVRATQSSYLWGLGEFSWRVNEVIAGRSLVLENWGAFVLVPLDDTTTRLFIRTRGDGGPGLAAVVFGPVNVFVFEPAHFIMQRAMMLGIQDRAERMMRHAAVPGLR